MNIKKTMLSLVLIASTPGTLPAMKLAHKKKTQDIELKTIDRNSLLHKAILKRATKKELLEHLEKGASLEVKNKAGQTPLASAIENKLTKISIFLINQGANLTTKDCFGNTYLMCALEQQLTEVALALIEKGIPLDTQNNAGDSALMLAARNGCLLVCTILIDKGVAVDTKNLLEFTPLIWAAKKGYENIVDLLLSKGADISARNRYGETALTKCKRGTETYKLLKEAYSFKFKLE